jgi:hypothetical protein
MSDSETKACCNCKFWHCVFACEGTCRKHAPTPVINPKWQKLREVVTWPQTDCDDVCGEHEYDVDTEPDKS